MPLPLLGRADLMNSRPSHSITSSARSTNCCGMVRLSALAVVRLTTSSNFVACSTGISIRVVRSVGHEPPSSDKVTGTKDRRQPRTQRERENAREVGTHQLINCDVKGIGLHTIERWCNISRMPNFEWYDFQSERICSGFGFFHLQVRLGIAGIKDDSQSAQRRSNFAQELYSLSSKISRLQR